MSVNDKIRKITADKDCLLIHEIPVIVIGEEYGTENLCLRQCGRVFVLASASMPLFQAICFQFKSINLLQKFLGIKIIAKSIMYYIII